MEAGEGDAAREADSPTRHEAYMYAAKGLTYLRATSDTIRAWLYFCLSCELVQREYPDAESRVQVSQSCANLLNARPNHAFPSLEHVLKHAWPSRAAILLILSSNQRIVLSS